jgi:hypothetical protein
VSELVKSGQNLAGAASHGRGSAIKVVGTAVENKDHRRRWTIRANDPGQASLFSWGHAVAEQHQIKVTVQQLVRNLVRIGGSSHPVTLRLQGCVAGLSRSGSRPAGSIRNGIGFATMWKLRYPYT